MALFSTWEATRPQQIDLLLLKGFSLMSLASTMEPLRAANRVSARPLYEWTLLSTDGSPVLTSSGVSFPVARAFDVGAPRDALIVVAAFEPLKHSAVLLPRLRAVGRRGVPL